MKLIPRGLSALGLVALASFFLGLSLAEAAPRCLPAKSCKSKKQCLDEYSGAWKCVAVLPKKKTPDWWEKGDGGGRRDGGLSERDREALDRAAGRSRLQDCARRACSEREIEDAWNSANRRSGNDGLSHTPDGSGLSEADRAALDEAAARSAREDAERRARREREENP